MAMVKADAYGLGAVPAARVVFVTADGFAVARLKEALELREAGFSHRLLLLGTLLDETELGLCSAAQIDVTVHDAGSLAAIAAAAASSPLRVWLKFDCGMHRLGLDPDSFRNARRRLAALPGVTELVLMTHFSTTHEMDSPVMARQIARFNAAIEGHPATQVSAANSAVLIAHPVLRLGWVRPGITLYGENPLAIRHPLPLRAAMKRACGRHCSARYRTRRVGGIRWLLDRRASKPHRHGGHRLRGWLPAPAGQRRNAGVDQGSTGAAGRSRIDGLDYDRCHRLRRGRGRRAGDALGARTPRGCLCRRVGANGFL